MTYIGHTTNFKTFQDSTNVNMLKAVLELMQRILLLIHYLLTWEYYLSIYNSGILSNSGR